MRKLFTLCLLVFTLSASAQWQQTGSKVRYVNGLGIPTKDTAAGVAADSSQILIRPADSALYVKYKRTWLRVGGGGGSIAGSGTTNYIPKFTSSSAIGNSQIFDNGTNVGIGTAIPGYKLDVNGTGGFSGAITSSLSSGIFLDNSAGGTNATQIRIKNTGGDVRVGVESSTGGTIQVGTSAYAAVFGNQANYPVQFTTNGTTRMTLDASGNLGLGVTPSAWGSLYRAIQIGGTGLMGRVGTDAYLYANAFWDGSNSIYVYNGGASYYNQNVGTHAWYTAPSGTAGNAISFTQAMTLDASGNLGVGYTNPSFYGKLAVNGAAYFGNTGTTAGVLVRTVGINNTTVSSGTLWADSAPLNSVENKSTTANTAAGYAMNVGGGNAIAGILGIAESTSQASLGFYTGGSGTVAEKMRITSGGDVGISTTSPAGRFVVADGQTLLGTNTNNGVDRLQVNGSALVTGGLQAATTSGDVSLRTTATTYPFNISLGANAGIGMYQDGTTATLIGTNQTVSATAPLQIFGTTLRFNASGNNNAQIFTNSNERLRVNGTGNVIVDPTQLGTKLLVNTTTDAGTDRVQVAGSISAEGFKQRYLDRTTAYTATTGDYLIDCTTGTFTVTLYAASGNAGRILIIKNSGTGSITVDGNGAETIDGAATQTLGTQWSRISIMCDGTNWKIISN